MSIERSAAPPASVMGDSADAVFERVLNRLPNGVIVVDRELRIVFVNDAAVRLVDGDERLDRGDPLPDPWPDFSLRACAERLFTDESSVGTHLVDVRDCIVCVEGLTVGNAATAILVLEDITERERMRRAERHFVENAAHELRTPLAAIVSVVDVLEGGGKDDPDVRDRFLRHVRVHSERLVRLATSLLVLARIQTGREAPRLDLVPLAPLLSDVSRVLAPIDAVNVEVDAPAEITAVADRELLFHALENVAANSVKYTHAGRIAFTARDLGEQVEIEISDTGVGMDAADVAHAFDRFYRSRDPGQDGFGLGLSIASEAVRVLGGTITLESTPAEGTRVRIRLPSAKIIS